MVLKNDFSGFRPSIVITKNSRLVAPAICVFLIAITWAVFGQTLSHQFVNYDDGTYVYANPVVLGGISLRAIAWAFTHVHSQNWHPLTTISHMLDCGLFGLNAGGHHFTNVLLHSAVVLLLFLVLWQMTGAIRRSAFVAAIFAIHPLHVESVAWIAERKDVLSALFFMLTLAAYARFVRERSFGRYLTVAILFALGLMSKPMLVTVPFVLLLLDCWPLNRAERWLKLIVEKAPLFVLSAASCAATVLAQKQATGSADELPFLWRIENALVTCVTYIWQMLWPAKLAVFYPHPENQLPVWQIFLAAVLLVGISFIALALRKRHPYVFTGWFWYLIMLLPVIGIMQVGLQGHADRYTYLPQIGLYLVVTWAIADLTARWRHQAAALTCAGGAVIIALGLSAWKQTGYWKDSETLWRHALAVTLTNDVAHAGLGGVLLGRGRVDEAIENFQEALRIRPGNAEAHSSLAQALMQKGNAAGAISHWETAVELQPEDVAARDSLGAALIEQGRLSQAVAQWRESLKYVPDDGNALSNLAWVLAAAPDASMRNGTQAIEFARHASQIAKEQNPVILRTLAAAYAENGQFSDAIAVAGLGVRLAQSQRNSRLADELQRDIALYEAKAPVRDNSLTTSPP